MKIEDAGWLPAAACCVFLAIALLAFVLTTSAAIRNTQDAGFAEAFAGPLEQNDCFVQAAEREVRPTAGVSRKVRGAIPMKMILAITGTILLVMFELAFAGDLERLLNVKGMSCQACPPQVERELMKVSGVKAPMSISNPDRQRSWLTSE